MSSTDIVDVHAHVYVYVYPEGCFTEVLKSRGDFKLVENPRGPSLLYRGSHVMSVPAEQNHLRKRLAAMDGAGIATAILSDSARGKRPFAALR